MTDYSSESAKLNNTALEYRMDSLDTPKSSETYSYSLIPDRAHYIQAQVSPCHMTLSLNYLFVTQTFIGQRHFSL